MSYVIGAILGICSLFKKKSKYLFGFIFLYAWIIFGLNFNNPDYFNYKAVYNGNSYILDEPIYLMLCSFFSWLNMDYQVFVILLSLFGLGLIAKTIIDYSPYPNLVFCLYLIYPFCIDVVQVRSFLACSIVIYAIRFIIDYRLTHKKNNIVWFAGCILLATGFHYSAILYSVLGIQFFEPKKHRFMIYVVVPILFVFFTMNISNFLSIITELIGSYKANMWVGGKGVNSILYRFRLIVVRGALIALCILANHCKKIDKNQRFEKINIENNNLIDKKYVSENKSIIHINGIINNTFFISMIYILLYILFEFFLDSQYERMSRPALILGMILLSRYAFVLEKKNRNIILSFTVVYMILYFINIMFFADINGISWFDWVFRNVFENNLLFNYYGI